MAVATPTGFWYFVIFILFQLGCVHVSCYVPAHPTNSSQDAIAGGLNVTDISKLHLRWYFNGYYSQNVSYQLAGHGSQGISKGALVHFSETKVNNETPGTATPWIAMVSCDFNATNASEEIDVFTLARDKGAVAALLYSVYSLACVINPEYADPATFDQVFDIFSTQSSTSVSLIEYQFGQSGPTNESIYGVYDSRRLNRSAETMNATLEAGTPPEPGFLFGILQAYNATTQIDDATESGPSGGSSPTKKQNTALAMIILYVITGCVSALFCVVIISGAVRAIRHPERYGPRARNSRGDFGQSRAGGLTRAILDTFPVVKFRNSPSSPEHLRESGTARISLKDLGRQGSDGREVVTELKEGKTGDTDGRGVIYSEPSNIQTPIANTQADSTPQTICSGSHFYPRYPLPAVPDMLAESVQLELRSTTEPTLDREGVVAAAIGRETCPICIMDFEEGDDLRILPCEGKHRFHQVCVDPWLLELSSSCPICRKDFLALENIISGMSDNEYGEGGDYDPHLEPPSPSTNRFSRYLRFARRRRRGAHDHDQPPNPQPPPAT